MIETEQVLRYTAFTDDPSGGNPAGVVLDASGWADATMQAVAAEVGYSETAFLRPTDDPRTFGLRYFTPSAEVPFCGHATITTGVVLGERLGVGPFVFHTPAGEIPVDVESVTDNADAVRCRATLTSVEPALFDLADSDVAELLATLGWASDDLDPAFPPHVAFAGLRHPVIAANTRERLAKLDYDHDSLFALMARHEWGTIQLVWRESEVVFHVRDPAPVVGIAEDPATGAAAAAFGHYLRKTGLITPPATVVLHQGEDLGRPSVLTVEIGADQPRIKVTGTAVPL